MASKVKAGYLEQRGTSWYIRPAQTQQEAGWLLITPEGTRKKVEQYKTGFLRVAELAEVPVMLVSWDYPSKRIVLEKVWTTTGNHEADCQAMRQYLTNRYQARQPNWQ